MEGILRQRGPEYLMFSWDFEWVVVGVGEYPTSNINAINADLLVVAKLDNVMELQFLDRCISCYSRIRDQNAIPTGEAKFQKIYTNFGLKIF